MRRIGLRGFALAFLVLAVGLSSSAVSLAADTVTITSPSAGGSFQAPYTGPLSVDIGAGSQAGTYTFDVTGPGGYAWQTTWNYDGSQSSSSWGFTAATQAGTYTATATAPDATVDASITFTVTNPPPPPTIAVQSASVSPSAFYPLERDGYRDATVFRFQTNLAATDMVTIRNHLGQRVRRVQLGTLSGGSGHGFLWKGKKD